LYTNRAMEKLISLEHKKADWNGICDKCKGRITDKYPYIRLEFQVGTENNYGHYQNIYCEECGIGVAVSFWWKGKIK
jgi:hypothetical protein